MSFEKECIEQLYFIKKLKYNGQISEISSGFKNPNNPIGIMKKVLMYVGQ
jgi:hypothetical protein